MSPDFGGISNAIVGIAIFGFVAFVVIAILIVFTVIRIFRRSSAMIDPAEQELRARLARGEIDMAEFEVRLRALKRGDAS
jgi:uncharacterized membrane protein